LDLAIIVVYLLAMVAVGVYVYRRKQASSRDGFFVASRSGSTVLIVGSLCATFVGASVVVMMTGLGYFWGLPGAWWLLVGTVGLLVLGLFFARRVRRFGVYTLPEMVERQHGRLAGLGASLLIVVGWTGIIAAQIIAVEKIMAAVLPYDVASWIILTVTTAVFVLYTVLGGQFSVIRTDIVQFAILSVGILVALGFALTEAGGLSGLTSHLDPQYFHFPTNDKFGWEDLATWLILFGATYVVGPDIYARLFSARSESVARKSALWAALIAVPVAFVIVLVGMCAMVLNPHLGTDEAFPYIIANILPAGVAGLVAAGLLAAIMSSADTLLLTTGTILSQDIYKHVSRKPGRAGSVLVTRAAVLLMGVLALLVALRLESIIESLKLAYTIFTSGVLIPVVAGFYRDKLRLNSAGAMAAIVGGGGTALAIKLMEVKHLDLVGLAVCVVLLFGVSWLIRAAGWTPGQGPPGGGAEEAQRL
jgi:SSS family solute:Na+ symporter